MSNSSLVTYKAWTSHYGYSPSGKPEHGRYGKKIDKIFVHHMAGNLTVQQCGNVFKTRQASAHYGINGNAIGQYVDEGDVSWHCGNKAYNLRSIGIECANCGGASTNWKVSDATIKTLIRLLVDICRRNRIKKLNFTGNLNGNLCLHCYTQATACPGGYLKSKMSWIAKQVNAELAKGSTPTPEPTPTPTPAKKTWLDRKCPFLVKVEVEDLYIRKGAGIADYGRQTITVDGKKTQFCPPGVYTIEEVKYNEGYYWGKLKSSTPPSPRWIALDYCTFVREVKK